MLRKGRGKSCLRCAGVIGRRARRITKYPAVHDRRHLRHTAASGYAGGSARDLCASGEHDGGDRTMLTRLGGGIFRARWMVLGMALLLVAVASVYGFTGFSALKTGGFHVPASPPSPPPPLLDHTPQ